MDSKKLGMEIIENVPFQIDPDEPTKFTIVEGGFNTLYGNLFAMNNLLLQYYEEEKDNFPDKERIDIIDEILDVNNAAIKYAMSFLDENYPGVGKLLTEASFEDSFIAFLTETATNINAPQEIQQCANEIVCEMLRSCSNEMVGKILEHTLLSTLLAKGDQKELDG